MTSEAKVVLVFLAGAPVEIGLILAVLLSQPPRQGFFMALLVVTAFALPITMARVKGAQ